MSPRQRHNKARCSHPSTEFLPLPPGEGLKSLTWHIHSQCPNSGPPPPPGFIYRPTVATHMALGAAPAKSWAMKPADPKEIYIPLGLLLLLADSAGYGLPSPQTESEAKAAKATKASTALVSVHGRSETLTLLPFRGRFLATSHRPRARCANGDLVGTAGHVLGDLGEEPRLWGLT